MGETYQPPSETEETNVGDQAGASEEFKAKMVAEIDPRKLKDFADGYYNLIEQKTNPFELKMLMRDVASIARGENGLSKILILLGELEQKELALQETQTTQRQFEFKAPAGGN